MQCLLLRSVLVAMVASRVSAADLSAMNVYSSRDCSGAVYKVHMTVDLNQDVTDGCMEASLEDGTSISFKYVCEGSELANMEYDAAACAGVEKKKKYMTRSDIENWGSLKCNDKLDHSYQFDKPAVTLKARLLPSCPIAVDASAKQTVSSEQISEFLKSLGAKGSDDDDAKSTTAKPIAVAASASALLKPNVMLLGASALAALLVT